eukprot:TRINITY_DN1174_c0_g1_i4.p1 TRINITY_DN1174_c0_g1~~TRINITY_DN1174_c0_g1_i4.p1  ORF type:complete len:517 (+),score=24.19 TRINITY_DN1174_c0_g1_i4:195-1745(+)
MINENSDYTAQLTKVTRALHTGCGLLRQLKTFNIKTDLLKQVTCSTILSSAFYGLQSYGFLLSKKQIISLSAPLRWLAVSLTGCYKYTKTECLLVEAEIETVYNRLSRLSAIDYERYCRWPSRHTYSLVHESNSEPWTQFATSCRPSTCSDLRSLSPSPTDAPPPWQPQQNVIISPFLDCPRTDDPTTNRLLALKKIISFPVPAATVYTDGSYRNGVGSAAAAALYLQTGEIISTTRTLDMHNTIFRAEMHALLLAVQLVTQNEHVIPPGPILILSDSQSSLRSLITNQYRLTSDLCETFFNATRAAGRHYYLQYIPGHSCIEGNELADELAFDSAEDDDVPTPIDDRTAKFSIDRFYRRGWLNSRGNHFHARATDYSRVQKFDPTLTRYREVNLARLRVAYHPDVKTPHADSGGVSCKLCGSPVMDSQHLLIDCPRTIYPRLSLFPGKVYAKKIHLLFKTENQPNTSLFLRWVNHFRLTGMSMNVERDSDLDSAVWSEEANPAEPTDRPPDDSSN